MALSASGLPSGVTASFNPTSITSSGTATLTLTTNSTAPGGTYPITVTGASGSITHSATVTLAVQASAVFVKFDTTNQGTWKGVYGSNGWAIANDSTNFPAYAQVAFNGESSIPGRPPPPTSAPWSPVRRAAGLPPPGTVPPFSIDINLTDGNAHQVGLYALDWDNQGRAETISVTDATSGAVLDSRSISGFSNGEWLVWNLTGHVTITLTQIGSNPNANAVASGLFFDPAGPLTPDFLISATPSSQNVTRSSSANYTVAISPEGGFVGTVALSASGLPSGATASFSPTSISGSSTATLMLSTNNAVAGGSYPITVTGVSGSLTHNTTVTLVVQVAVPASAVFSKYDTTNQGTWKGLYGSNGWVIANDSNNYPAYAQVALNGESSYTWASSTTDVRALQSGVTNGRIASTWYGSSFSVDINLTDGNTHQVGLYAVDWDNQGRAETISVTDATSGAVLDSRSISGFNNGEWLLWDLAGHVKMTVTQIGSNPNANAVASGALLRPASVVFD